MVRVHVQQSTVDIDLQLFQQTELRVGLNERDGALLPVAWRARRRFDHLAELERSELHVVALVITHKEQLDWDKTLLRHFGYGGSRVLQADLINLAVVLLHGDCFALMLEGNAGDGLVN